MKGVIDKIIEYTAYAILALSALAFCILSVAAISEEEAVLFITAVSQLVACFILAILMVGFSALIENSYDMLYRQSNGNLIADDSAESEEKTLAQSVDSNNNEEQAECTFENMEENVIEDSFGNVAKVKKQDITIIKDGISSAIVNLDLEYEIVRNKGDGIFAPLLSWYNDNGEKINDIRLIVDMKNNNVKISKRMALNNKRQKIAKFVIGE